MKWKRALNIEQAALISVGIELTEPLSIEHYNYFTEWNRARYQSRKGSVEKSFVEACYERYKPIKEAYEIMNGLLDELTSISDARFYNKTPDSIIVIDKPVYKDDMPVLDHYKCEITKESVANWFYRYGDLEKAKNIIPNYTPKAEIDLSSINEIKKLKAQLEVANTEIEELKLKLESKSITTNQKTSTKPFQLIEQLIKIILPDADLQKAYQVHGQLNQKLSGEEVLAVSEQTLKSYFDKL